MLIYSYLTKNNDCLISPGYMMEFVAIINRYVNLTYTIEVNTEVRKYLYFLHEVFTNFCVNSDSCFFIVGCVECTVSLSHELCSSNHWLLLWKNAVPLLM